MAILFKGSPISPSSMSKKILPSQSNFSLDHLDKRQRQISYGDHLIKLTRKEFDILWQLVSHSGCVLARNEILEMAWGPKIFVDPRTVDAHIVRLRRKLHRLGERPPTIETVWALGYRFQK